MVAVDTQFDCFKCAKKRELIINHNSRAYIHGSNVLNSRPAVTTPLAELSIILKAGISLTCDWSTTHSHRLSQSLVVHRACTDMLRYCTCGIPSNHGRSSHCSNKVGPPSTTLNRHQSNIGILSRVCCKSGLVIHMSSLVPKHRLTNSRGC